MSSTRSPALASSHSAAATWRAARDGARQLGIGDVADEDVPEGVLGLAGHRGVAGRSDELLAGELAHRLA